MKSKGILLVISGFAGAGKGTIVRELVKRYDDYALSVSATTRAPREGEEHGVHYFFVEQETFDEMKNAGELLESAVYANGCSYGTPKSYVEEKRNEGKDVILEIDIQGALAIKEKYPETLLIFLTAPDAKTQESRLRGRGTETEEDIKKRLARAVEESEGIDQYDYLVINDDCETCISQVHHIIQSEHFRTWRNKEKIKELRQDFKRFML